MKKTISIICLILALIMAVACVKTPMNPDKEIEEEGKVDMDLTKFEYYDAFNEYLKNASNYSDNNFIASPTSLRAALCLAIAGADEGTLDELLKAAGFESKEDAEKWYQNVISMTEQFAEDLKQENELVEEYGEWYSGGKADRAFEIVNSIWNNEDVSSDFKEEYKKYVEESLGAEARSEKASDLADSINAWCNEKTKGMIPNIIDDASDIAAILANALYLRTSWMNEFWYGGTHEDTFACKDGSETKKEFMEQADEEYRYYSDGDTQIVLLPMAGNITFACVLGDASNMDDRIAKAMDWDFRHVHLVIPKLEIESTFKDEMISFLRARGAALPFTHDANFSSMSDSEDWYIKAIVQKAKIKSDEKGLEAAAVTAIVMEANGMMIEEEPVIVDFVANKPFSFFIYSDIYGEAPEMLFCGQVVK